MIELANLLFRCTDTCTPEIEEFEQLLKTTHGAEELDLPDRSNLKLRNSFVQFHNLGVGFWAFGTSTKITFPPRATAALGVTLRGKGEVISGLEAADAGRPTLTSPSRPLKLRYGGDLEKVFVIFGSEALKRKLSALLGAPVNRDPEFKLNEFTSQEMLNGMIGLIKSLVLQICSPHSLTSPLALRELEDALIMQLLFTGRHKLSERLQRKPLEASPNPVARAEQFIEANWNHPITLETLSEVTGVSGRTLLRTFARARGYSPMVFAKKIRLERVRAQLRRPAVGTTVTAAALACGFSNLGRFAQDYWRMFGELPSQTLHLARPRIGRAQSPDCLA